MILLFVFLGPVSELALVAWATSGDIEHIPTAIVDRDHSAASRALVQALENTETFDADYYPLDEAEARALVDRARCWWRCSSRRVLRSTWLALQRPGPGADHPGRSRSQRRPRRRDERRGGGGRLCPGDRLDAFGLRRRRSGARSSTWTCGSGSTRS